MKIIFDPEKYAFTLETRGLDMADAAQVFMGRNVTMQDDRNDYAKLVMSLLGLSINEWFM